MDPRPNTTPGIFATDWVTIASPEPTWRFCWVFGNVLIEDMTCTTMMPVEDRALREFAAQPRNRFTACRLKAVRQKPVHHQEPLIGELL